MWAPWFARQISKRNCCYDICFRSVSDHWTWLSKLSPAEASTFEFRSANTISFRYPQRKSKRVTAGFVISQAMCAFPAYQIVWTSVVYQGAHVLSVMWRDTILHEDDTTLSGLLFNVCDSRERRHFFERPPRARYWRERSYSGRRDPVVLNGDGQVADQRVGRNRACDVSYVQCCD